MDRVTVFGIIETDHNAGRGVVHDAVQAKVTIGVIDVGDVTFHRVNTFLYEDIAGDHVSSASAIGMDSGDGSCLVGVTNICFREAALSSLQTCSRRLGKHLVQR